jgi:hypothetical protein
MFDQIEAKVIPRKQAAELNRFEKIKSLNSFDSLQLFRVYCHSGNSQSSKTNQNRIPTVHGSRLFRTSQPSVVVASSTALQLPMQHNTLQRLLALGPSAANPPGLRALQVLGGNPALVENASLSTSSDSRAIRANNRDLVGRVDLLSSLRGSLSALAALAAPLLLREQSRNPGVVDEVAGAAESGEEEEVEEDAVESIG